MNRFAPALKAKPALALSVILLAGLTACGGGSSSSDPTAQPAAAPQTAASTTTSPDSSVASALAATSAQPLYHMAPVLLDEPDQSDVGGTNASAHQAPKSFRVDGELANTDTARLTRQALVQRIAETSRTRTASASSETAPQTVALIGAIHTPAQIRAAYGLPAYPPAGTTITAAMAATFGAGQTIYLIDAYHDATALSDLNLFSAKFGLPTCTNAPVATTAILPLAAPPASSCAFSQVSVTTTGTMTATIPAYNATWAPESKLDVQWAHAIAPLARIVLLEMPDSLSTSILGANMLAGRMGPGVVSMSFGSAEAAWAPSIDYHFAGTGMTYVAAAGDSGSQVLWPAVSSNVVAVGATSLNWTGSGARYEAAWPKTGGGLSAYEPLPTWQSGVAPAGGGALPRRAVPDVSFNGDPYTGEYVALTLPGDATVWSGYGGTSIAAPQWAATIAVANAMRASVGKATLGDIHTTLYKSIAAVPGTYAASLGDVVDGVNGTCATCRAGTGFDEATGWGTPNAAQLLATLSGVTVPQSATPAAPTVPGGTISGKVGTALSQSLNVTLPAGTTATYTLSGAPSGLTVDGTGTMHWAAPVAGTYSIGVKATTSVGTSASATYTLQVVAAAATPPVLSSSGKFTATAGTAFSGTLTASNPNAGTLIFSIAGAPAGLTVNSTGVLSWAAPVAGTYTFTAYVKDSFGYWSSQTETLSVGAAALVAPSAPSSTVTLATGQWTSKAGAAFSTMVAGHATDGGTLSYTATGMPSGMTLTASGFVYYPNSAKGTYNITVTVHDSKGSTASAVMTLTVS